MSKFHSGIKREEILGILKRKDVKIHFVGVGGVGMYSLCVLSHTIGYKVSGSDRENSQLCDDMRSRGIKITVGHTPDAVRGADLVVYTLAVGEDNPELLFAESNGIQAASRAEYLGAIMCLYGERIGISGSHGKSTTASMIKDIFTAAGLEPTSVIGAARNGETPLTVGKRDYMIYEACEYKDSFLRFFPSCAVFLNLEYDHVDYFKSLEALSDSFLLAMQNSPICIVNSDDENLDRLIPKLKRRPKTFGESVGCDVRGVIRKCDGGLYALEIFHTGGSFSVNLKVFGRHNAKNALAAAATALEYGISPSIITRALESFSGIERRLEVIGERGNAKIYYDYAHHPTEIRCAIESVREREKGRICVIFKPHTYSRTAAFLLEFADALALADNVILCDISAVREDKISGVSSERLAELIGEKARVSKDSEVCSEFDRLSADAVIIMGAADLNEVRRDIIGK